MFFSSWSKLKVESLEKPFWKKNNLRSESMEFSVPGLLIKPVVYEEF